MEVLPTLSPAMITAQLAFRAAFHDISPRGGPNPILGDSNGMQAEAVSHAGVWAKCYRCGVNQQWQRPIRQVYFPPATPDTVNFLWLCGEICQRPRGLHGDSCSVLQAFFVICYD